jgi:hypothetical protein
VLLKQINPFSNLPHKYFANPIEAAIKRFEYKNQLLKAQFKEEIPVNLEESQWIYSMDPQ